MTVQASDFEQTSFAFLSFYTYDNKVQDKENKNNNLGDLIGDYYYLFLLQRKKNRDFNALDICIYGKILNFYLDQDKVYSYEEVVGIVSKWGVFTAPQLKNELMKKAVLKNDLDINAVKRMSNKDVIEYHKKIAENTDMLYVVDEDLCVIARLEKKDQEINNTSLVSASDFSGYRTV